jgi:hypothetical protein
MIGEHTSIAGRLQPGPSMGAHQQIPWRPSAQAAGSRIPHERALGGHKHGAVAAAAATGPLPAGPSGAAAPFSSCIIASRSTGDGKKGQEQTHAHASCRRVSAPRSANTRTTSDTWAACNRRHSRGMSDR